MYLDQTALACSENKNKVICDHCALKSLCMPANVTPAEQLMIDQLLTKQVTVKRGQYLQSEGQPFSEVYVVKAGAFKAETCDQSTISIRAFFMPGEFLGLDAIVPKQYLPSFKALENSTVCAMSYQDLLNLMQKYHSL